jgi:hypothetical protein
MSSAGCTNATNTRFMGYSLLAHTKESFPVRGKKEPRSLLLIFLSLQIRPRVRKGDASLQYKTAIALYMYSCPPFSLLYYCLIADLGVALTLS